MTFKPRPKQQEVIAYTGGKMGVAAVPGSGKTKTLSYLAAKLVAEKLREDDQEVLIVTLVNSAVDNFKRQVAEFVRERGLIPNYGYRVRTLHGLASDIVRERPALAGLADDFTIVDEREADEILQDAVATWVKTNPDTANGFINGDIEGDQREWIKRDQWPLQVTDIARAFIRQSKDMQLTPEDVRELLDGSDNSFILAEVGYEIYVSYQRALGYRGAVDFQDLIRLALKALQADESYLERMQKRWPYILEDEAQDSSALQEEILRLLSENHGNWVRVGDPNQSIYETFTTARPEYLRDFIKYEPNVQARELPNSGRSSLSIIRLANHLIDWTMTGHFQEIRDRAPLQPPYIEPTPKGDPQPNPADDPAKVVLYPEAITPAREIEMVIQSLARWLPENQDQTVAVLVPRNRRGFELIDALKQMREPKIEYVELLRSTTSTRETAGALANILNYLGDPGSANLLSIAYRVWRRHDREDPMARAIVEAGAKLLRGCHQVEDYINPGVERDWLAEVQMSINEPEVYSQLNNFRALIRRWQNAVVLPIDQLILTLAGDLFQGEADLAVAHSLAVFMRRAAQTHPHWRIPQYIDELTVIARNERRFLGMSEDDLGFDPEKYKGKVCVATMHSAKGLEWDRVYLLSVNTYDFPSAQIYDQYISEKWFVRDGMNLEAEALAQLNALIERAPYTEGEATQEARLNYAAERLRLLYVGITRARKELVITWNTGRRGDQQPAIPLIALQTFWEEQRRAASR
jgi:DNA helicase II / ATP-dependent DNA helicase PcrA